MSQRYFLQYWADFRGRFAGAQQQYLHRHQVLLTGAGAAQAIASKLGELQVSEGDIVVIQRGGGPAATLVAFDDPITVAAIRQCPVPVFTAIGHSGDSSACDRAAEASYTTPTALGEALAKVLGRQFYQHKRSDNPRTPVTAAKPASEPYRRRVNTPLPPLTPRPVQPPTAFPTYPSRPAAHHSGIPLYQPSSSRTWADRPAGGPSRLGTASLVLGIISVLTFGGLLFGALVGLILGLIALSRRPRGRAIAGICLNVVGLGIVSIPFVYWTIT